jgi:hypothetical protein
MSNIRQSSIDGRGDQFVKAVIVLALNCEKGVFSDDDIGTL